jgi:hypothetical protein
MAYVPSQREQVLDALYRAIKAALPNANVERNRDKPESSFAGGDVVQYDGDPGEPELDFCPTIYNYNHAIPFDVLGPTGDNPEQLLDATLQTIGGVIESDRTLGGLCEYLEASAPELGWMTRSGAVSIRTAAFTITASYRTQHPL